MISLTAKYLFYVKLIIIILNDYRSTYDNLKRSYQHFGQFQYSDWGDQRQMQTCVYKDSLYVEIKSLIKGNNTSLFWSITVYNKGKIEEKEWSDWSRFKRKRVILENGFWEEYSIHNTTGFGNRKVVYPDGQKFTNEVYHCDTWRRGWNAIGEETYAIHNKSIPYLLGNNKIEEYKYVTEDGLLNTIDLSENNN